MLPSATRSNLTKPVLPALLSKAISCPLVDPWTWLLVASQESVCKPCPSMRTSCSLPDTLAVLDTKRIHCPSAESCAWLMLSFVTCTIGVFTPLMASYRYSVVEDGTLVDAPGVV